MIKRINFTNRRRITRDQVELTADFRRVIPSVRVRLSLDPGVTKDATVVLEAYRHARVQRFELDSKRLAEEQSFDFSQDLGALVLFRVKVVDASPGLPVIRAEADRLAPTLLTDSGRRRSALLPVDPTDIGKEVWRVHFEQDRPVLQVNRQVEDIMWFVANDPSFRSLVFPSALRIILTRFLLEEQGVVEDDDVQSPAAMWLRFGAGLVGDPAPKLEEAEEAWRINARDWVNDAGQALSKRILAAPRYNAVHTRPGA